MKIILYSILGIMIPFIGTCIGSMFVFFCKKELSDRFHKCMIGIAVGVMLAASVWSLIIPSIDMSSNIYVIKCLPTIVGLVLGIIFLICVDIVSRKIENNVKKEKINMLWFSVTLHNIPEGMAVGVCFAGLLSGNAEINLINALILALGIGIQNVPEGAIISMPMHAKGKPKFKSFISGVISGIVEPIAAIFTIALLNLVVPLLPYLLSFAAGAMIYVVIEELVPEMQVGKKSYCGILSVIFGFIIMLFLDVMLG